MKAKSDTFHRFPRLSTQPGRARGSLVAGQPSQLPARRSREYAPTVLGNQLLLETRYGTLEQLTSSTRYEQEVWLRTDRSTLLQINQFYFPGWQVTVDGQIVPDETLRQHLAPNGLMRVPIRVSREGSSQRLFVRAYYSGPLGETRGFFAALLGVVLLLLHRRYEPAQRR